MKAGCRAGADASLGGGAAKCGSAGVELATLKFIDAREGALLIGPPGVGKSHIAKALAHLAVQRGRKVLYREAHVLIEEINEARELGEIRKYRAQLKAAELLVIDDLFLRRLPPSAGEELAATRSSPRSSPPTDASTTGPSSSATSSSSPPYSID